jgi:hypothetical protein
LWSSRSRVACLSISLCILPVWWPVFIG